MRPAWSSARAAMRSRLWPCVVGALAATSLTACSQPLDAPAGPQIEAVPDAPVADSGVAPAGTVRVAYPQVVNRWSGLDEQDTAATDLFALWGLPLVRIDQQGQHALALAARVRFPPQQDGWAIELDLREGEWSDGRPVSPADVVATAEALREAASDRWGGLTAATVVDANTVRLAFAAPMGRWADLLAAPPGVLPAHVLADGGLSAYDDGVPVSGGSFHLVEDDRGRSTTFAAHPDGPLGSSGPATVEVLVVPSFETSLGLLEQGEVDVVTGHLPLNPVARAQEVAGIEAAAPLGGTTVSLRWLREEGLGDEPAVRRQLARALDLEELVTGLLGPAGAPATSPVPGIEGPWDAAVPGATRDGRGGEVADLDRTLILLVPRGQEVLGFTSRAIQRDLGRVGVTLRLVSIQGEDLLQPVDPHDARLEVRRTGPRPFLTTEADQLTPAPTSRLARALEPAFAQLHEEAFEIPLFRAGPITAWAPGRVTGVLPSAWPGVALASVSQWQPSGATDE